MRRGLTLLELLLAVALLAAVSSAIVPLTRLSLGEIREIDQDLLWQRSAGMTLNEIGFVILTRDRRGSPVEPVTLDQNTLRVRTASGAAVSLGLRGTTLKAEQPGVPPRVLLGQLSEIGFTINEDTGRLNARLVSTNGLSAERSWGLQP